MALTQCPECNKDVATTASICVHCGHPLKAEQSKASPTEVVRPGRKYELVGFLSMVASFFAGFLINAWLGVALFVGGFIIFLVGRFK